MTLEEIKRSVDAGKVVCWSSPCYRVIRDGMDRYLIKCTFNGSCIGLTWADGRTLNGAESEFYLGAK